MKLKLDRKEAYWLEDILLDIYYGLPVSSLEGNDRLNVVINRIQDKIEKEDILDE